MEGKLPLCIVIPAYNEAAVIGFSLKALIGTIHADHIYVVSDGSSDTTAKIARLYTPNVLELTENVGKATALSELITHFHLTERYRYISFADADSRFSARFFREAIKCMAGEPACIVGRVVSDRRGWISAFRTYEYAVSHQIYKQAQHFMRAVLIAPGCASIYRSNILHALDFSHHTLTEDFDLTLQIHLRQLGQIVYTKEAVVVTQDPYTLRDYWKQIMRWYTGFWQNALLHRLYRPTNRLSFEFYLNLVDTVGLLAFIGLGFLYPLFFLRASLVALASIQALAVIVIALERRWWALPYIPLFPLFYVINIVAYLCSFLRMIRNRKKPLHWQKVKRYAM